MKELNLPLERKWYEMTDVNGKTEEYRKIDDHWKSRLTDQKKGWKRPPSTWKFKHFDINVMTLGYPKKNDPLKTKKYKHLGIEIGYGRQDWGAPKDELVFIIKHGEEIKITT
jgi:hypothetical protein